MIFQWKHRCPIFEKPLQSFLHPLLIKTLPLSLDLIQKCAPKLCAGGTNTCSYEIYTCAGGIHSLKNNMSITFI